MHGYTRVIHTVCVYTVEGGNWKIKGIHGTELIRYIRTSIFDSKFYLFYCFDLIGAQYCIKFKVYSRVSDSDPDPCWIRIRWVAGSGSKFWMRIRVRIQEYKKGINFFLKTLETLQKVSFFLFSWYDYNVILLQQVNIIENEIEIKKRTMINHFWIKF